MKINVFRSVSGVKFSFFGTERGVDLNDNDALSLIDAGFAEKCEDADLAEVDQRAALTQQLAVFGITASANWKLATMQSKLAEAKKTAEQSPVAPWAKGK